MSKQIPSPKRVHSFIAATCSAFVFTFQVGQAYAQEEALEEILVVGSQIKGASIEGALPVTVVDSELLESADITTGDDLLRSIPQIGSVGFGASRGGITGVNAARGDVASYNLRSIGDGNTLVLINGRRMVLHPITQTSSVDGVPVASPNANTLPVSALERVEVLRDGAGALYGADAVAGVINYQIKDDYEGSEFSIRYGAESGTGREDIHVSGATGFQLNDGKTRVVLTGNYADQTGILANEKFYSSNQDLRGLVPERFSSDTSLDQRSSLEAFANLRYNGLGGFHVRPAELTRDNGGMLGVSDCGGRGLDGADVTFNDGQQVLCLDSSSQDRALRPNRNELVTLVPDIKRYNFFSKVTHELDSGAELYGEVSYYKSEATRQREQASILSNGRFFVPADYYYNPFGPVTFNDGRPNPNRLPGLDTSIVPESGLGFELLSLRPSDVGLRQTTVDGESYRLLAGIQGNWGDWDYDSAVLYSRAEVDDTTTNRISTPALQSRLTLNTPDAYNIFTGVNPADSTSLIDATPNPRERIDPFITSASRKAETTLKSIDLRVSNPSIFALPAGDAAVGFGVEYREEDLDENNSAIFDGSMPFIDPLDPSLGAGEVTNLSSLQGSSVRPDVKADRSVFSVYGELILPVLRDMAFAKSLDVQIAARYEDFDDVGSITRPKFALSWYPVDWLQVRGSYSEGFRAPNLIQLNSPATSITTSVDDFAEGILLGSGDIDDGPANGNYILETSGNADLEPEESENFSLGLVFTPTQNLTITADWWQIETTGTVGVFSDENESRLDAVLRSQGSFNPRVLRGAPDANNPLGEIQIIQRRFENLNTRTVSGFDIGAFYNLETSAGAFDFQVNLAHLEEFEQEPGGNAEVLVNFGADPTVLGASVGDLIQREFFPELRATASVIWNSPSDNWGASVFARFVDEVFEPTVTDDDDNFYFLDSHTTVDVSVTRRNIFGDNSSIRLGISNIFDEDPPVAREAFGFEGELHSSRARYFSATFKKSFN